MFSIQPRTRNILLVHQLCTLTSIWTMIHEPWAMVQIQADADRDWIKFAFEMVSNVENELVTICFVCLPRRCACALLRESFVLWRCVCVCICVIHLEYSFLCLQSIGEDVLSILHSRPNLRHMETISESKIRITNDWQSANADSKYVNDGKCFLSKLKSTRKRENQMNSILLAISNCFDRRCYFIAARASFYHGAKTEKRKTKKKKVKNYSQ